AVLSVSLDNEKTVNDLVKEVENRGINYPVVYDEASYNADRWCIKTIPATFLVDPEGRLVETDISTRNVRDVMQRTQQQQVMPQFMPGNSSMQRITSSYKLLEDSPSTGLPYYRDLEITLPIP